MPNFLILCVLGSLHVDFMKNLSGHVANAPSAQQRTTGVAHKEAIKKGDKERERERDTYIYIYIYIYRVI